MKKKFPIGADCVRSYAGGGWGAGSGSDPQGGDQRADFYRWKANHDGLEVDQVRHMKQLRDEHTRLKQLMAELNLDKTMLQDVLRKKL